MQHDEIVGEIGVCDDCMLWHANGEISPDRPANLPEVWSALRFGYSMTMGGEHADGCPNGPDGSCDTDCDCNIVTFSRTACEGCGDWHHGTRHVFTLWRLTDSAARFKVWNYLGEARRDRSVGDLVRSGLALAHAAQYRGYLMHLERERRAIARFTAGRK